MALVYAYYLGELVQFSVTPREKWKEFLNRNQIPDDYYFYRGINRVYKLFQRNPSQIYYTVTLTFKIISRMKITEYQELLQCENELSDFANNIELS